jgi:hypothetical protein
MSDIKVSNTEIGCTYFRNGVEVKVVAKVKYGATLEEASGRKTMVPLDLMIQTKDPIVQPVQPVDQVKPTEIQPVEPSVEVKNIDDDVQPYDPPEETKSQRPLGKRRERTGVTKTLDNILLTAPSPGYTVKEIIDKVRGQRPDLVYDDKKLKSLVHMRMWYLKMNKNCKNIATDFHRYSLRKGE